MGNLFLSSHAFWLEECQCHLSMCNEYHIPWSSTCHNGGLCGWPPRKIKDKRIHIDVLTTIFDRLKKYKVRLNPKKCVFEVKSGKLLGYIVSRRGIEVDPAKVKAMMDMPPPTTLKQLHSFQGKLQSIRRFVSQLANKVHPLQHFLRKGNKFQLDCLCQKAFEQVKVYMANPLWCLC